MAFSIHYFYINIERRSFDTLTNYEFQCPSSHQEKCNIVYLRAAAYNRQYQQGLFIGFATNDPASTSHEEGEGDDKETKFDYNNCDENEVNTNVFSDRFENETTIPASPKLFKTFIEQPGCFTSTNHNLQRSDHYNFLSIYNWEDSSYIAMSSNLGQFDTEYSIIDEHQYWAQQLTFPKPSSVNDHR